MPKDPTRHNKVRTTLQLNTLTTAIHDCRWKPVFSSRAAGWGYTGVLSLEAASASKYQMNQLNKAQPHLDASYAPTFTFLTNREARWHCDEPQHPNP
jgi:hypothetical protein